MNFVKVKVNGESEEIKNKAWNVVSEITWLKQDVCPQKHTRALC